MRGRSFFDAPAFDDASRAASQDPMHKLGDPEQWGGHQATSVAIAAGGAGGSVFGFSPQFIRAQAPNLIAVPWDLLVTWTIDGVHVTGANVDDTITLALDLTIGTGRATSRLLFTLVDFAAGTAVAAISQQNPASGSNGLFPFPSGAQLEGVAQTFEPTPAVAVSARLLLNGSTTAALHTVSAKATAHVAPRGYPV